MTKLHGNLPDFAGRRLLAVLAYPPTTSGFRTLSKLEEFKNHFDFETFHYVNLNAVADYRTTSKNPEWDEQDSWIDSRREISAAIKNSDFVLLAYGVRKPTGIARRWHSDQIQWLHKELQMQKKHVMQVGDEPRHPSRWHRKSLRAEEGMTTLQGVLENLQMIDLE